MASLENEGKRADEEKQNTVLLFHYYIHRKIEDFPGKISFNRFSEIFSDLWEKPKKGEKLYKVVIEQSKKTMLNEIDVINKDIMIDEKLKSKDALVSEYSDKKGTIQWRPDGNVEKTLLPHDMEAKLQILRSLQEKVEQNKKSVAELKEIVDKNSTEINKIKNSVDEAKIKKMYNQEEENYNQLLKIIEELSDTSWA